MTSTREFMNVSHALPMLLKDVLTNGAPEPSRNGGVRELLMNQFTLRRPWQRYITTPGRKASLPAQIAETMWLLAGRDDIAWLSHYLPRAAEFSDDGVRWRGAYGPRLRGWDVRLGDGSTGQVDQLAHVVQLLKDDPTTRRAVISIYDPAVDTEPGKDIPCNNWIHFVARDGKLQAHVTIRSNDLMWGWSGINAFEWSALQEIVAGLVGLQQGALTFSISSLHLYEPHWQKGWDIIHAADRQFGVIPKRAPRFDVEQTTGTLDGVDALVQRWFRVEQIIREEPRGSAWEHIKAFPEPMLRSWLFALYAWHHADHRDTQAQMMKDAGLHGTDLDVALKNSPQRKRQAPVQQAAPTPQQGNFAQVVAKLHEDKDAVYGTSWKKRGEQISILPNIARKVDRLAVAGGGDTAADTVIDLLVYLIKYRLWLTGDPTEGAAHVARVAHELQVLGDLPNESLAGVTTGTLVQGLEARFDAVVDLVESGRDRWQAVGKMIPRAHALALRLWEQEQAEQQQLVEERKIWKKGN